MSELITKEIIVDGVGGKEKVILTETSRVTLTSENLVENILKANFPNAEDSQIEDAIVEMKSQDLL